MRFAHCVSSNFETPPRPFHAARLGRTTDSEADDEILPEAEAIALSHQQSVRQAATIIMAKHFLTQVANDVLEATERVADRMEEGLTLLFNSGKLPEKNDAEPAAAHDDGSEYVPLGDEYEDQAHLEEELRNNPLQGIADSVVGDIMSGQASHATIGCKSVGVAPSVTNQSLSARECFPMCLE